MLYSSRDLLIQTDLPLMYLTAQHYAVSCLPSQQSASSQAVFFCYPIKQIYYLFNVNASANQRVLSGIQCSKVLIWIIITYTEHGYYLMDKSTFSFIYARLFIFSFDWTWFYYLTSLKLFVQRLHQVYFEVFKLFSQTKYDATYIWCINRLL